MVLQVDPARDRRSGVRVEGDGERLRAIASRFSREDLLRAFELVAKLEQDVKVAAQPRFHLEMALLRWVHLRKLVPLPRCSTACRRCRLAGARAGPAAGTVRAAAAPAPARLGSARAAPHVVRAAGEAAARRPPVRPPAPPRRAGERRRVRTAAPRDLLVEDVSEAALARFREAFLGRGQALARPGRLGDGASCRRGGSRSPSAR